MKFLAESSLGEFTAQAVEGQTYIIGVSLSIC